MAPSHCAHISGDRYALAHVLTPFWFSRFFSWCGFTREENFAVSVIRAYLWETFEASLFCITPEEWGAGVGGTRSYLHEWRENSLVVDPVCAFFGIAVGIAVSYSSVGRARTVRFDNLIVQLLLLALATGATYVIRFGKNDAIDSLWLYVIAYGLLLCVDSRWSDELWQSLLFITTLSIAMRLWWSEPFAAISIVATVWVAVATWLHRRRLGKYVKGVFTVRRRVSGWKAMKYKRPQPAL